ncbi:MAG: hypothetical protein R3B13_08740 [Polyangiaceae bacterium]
MPAEERTPAAPPAGSTPKVGGGVSPSAAPPSAQPSSADARDATRPSAQPAGRSPGERDAAARLAAPTLDDLLAADRTLLEGIYRDAPLGPSPRGVFLGSVLTRVDSALARSRVGVAMAIPFERVRFGVDFDTCRWFFHRQDLQIGHFTHRRQRSQWRDTEVIALHYDPSRLPRWIRGALYDEVKPLSDRLCLGIGGINRGAGAGDVFFFALAKI